MEIISFAENYYMEKEFDVVERMYAYMNRKSVGSNPVSDPDYMFRESHTDRFVVALSDVSVIKAIDFYVTASDYNYKWKTNSFRIICQKQVQY